MFKQLTIIGGGLIGSSLALAVQARKLGDKLVIVDTDSQARRAIAEVTHADRVVAGVAEIDTDSDCIIVAVPVGQSRSVFTDVAHMALSPDCVITDVGSVKATVVAEAQILERACFVGSHPLAGTEHSGPRAAQEDLFTGRVCVMTPTDDSSDEGQVKIKALWQALDMRVMTMSPQEHDRIVALSSHLPHAIAFALAACIRDKDQESWGAIEALSGGGLKDFIRVAASDPTMWRDIFIHNRKPLSEAIDAFRASLDKLETMIEKDEKNVHGWLAELRTWRRGRRGRRGR